MSWIRKSPFGRLEDSVTHILDLLAKEADRAGVPLTDAERSVLITQLDLENPISEELSAKTEMLVNLVLDHEADIDDPKSLGNSLEWASDGMYTNVAALTEGVILSRGEGAPRLRGRRWVIDRIQLVGCGLVAVILMMLLLGAVSLIFHWK